MLRKVKGAHGQDLSDTDLLRQHNETGNAVRSVTWLSLPYLRSSRPNSHLVRRSRGYHERWRIICLTFEEQDASTQVQGGEYHFMASPIRQLGSTVKLGGLILLEVADSVFKLPV
jgi:hypothetical protein